ncbi:MAG: hypothetical protein IPM66_14745 [Acidobacteriota bacterium]|nr:MAG: hypothetical protein IPM66_14745 [Acidobacteriota bacterium]
MKETGNENSILVCVDSESLHKSHNITGGIWIEIAGFHFPEINWSDFPEVILEWWQEALFELRAGKKAHAECLFMDGPYLYKVIREDSRHVLRCYHNALSGKQAKWEGEIDLDILLRQVLKATSVILQECRHRGWKTRDTETLITSYTYIDGVVNPRSA